MDAQEILLKHWPHLRHSYVFVQAALRIATPECLAAVDKVIKECPEPKRLLAFVHWGIGVEVKGEEGSLSRRHLEALQPYLDLLEDSTVEALWKFCNRRKLFSWRQKHLDPLLNLELRNKLGLENAALCAELDRYAAEDVSSIHMEYWVERFEERGYPIQRAKEILARWLQERQTVEALTIVGRCLALIGKRGDLVLLEDSGLPAGDPRVAEILSDTWFEVCRRTLV